MNQIENKYYNEHFKKNYLQEKEKHIVSSNYIDVQFRKSSNMEFQLDKDICNWNICEIVKYYKSLNITSFEILICLNSIFSQYCQFCIEQNLTDNNQNYFLGCTRELLLNCINKEILDKKIIVKETILKWVDELPNPKDQFILLSLFEFGKSKDFKDIVNAKPQDLDKQNKRLKLLDRDVYISSKLIDIIDDCNKENYYYSITGKGVKIMPLIDYGYIVKSYPNQNINLSDFQKGRNIYIACQRIFDYLGVGEYMSPNSIVESGKLYMIKERAKQLGITSIQYLYSENIKEVEMQFGCTITKSIYSKKYDEYMV